MNRKLSTANVLALFVHVAHARGETLLVPAVRGAVVAAAIAQHHVRIGEYPVAALFPRVHLRAGGVGGEPDILHLAVFARVVAGHGEDCVGRLRRQAVDLDRRPGVLRAVLGDALSRFGRNDPRGLVYDFDGRRRSCASCSAVTELAPDDAIVMLRGRFRGPPEGFVVPRPRSR